mgnify:FL=1
MLGALILILFKTVMKSFWNKLPRPFFALAPLANVTDCAFRELVAKYGKPDVMWTEFVSADGLCSPVGREKLMIDLAYTEAERPIVAQIFSSKPENIREAAKLVALLGFDGVDINMGCPDRTIEKQNAGAALIKNPKLAQEIIYAAKEGAGDLPVSVKTRIGYNKDILDEWIPMLLLTKPAAITIHARTRKEMSKLPARWEAVARAVKLRDEAESETLIIGNGDVKDLTEARARIRETGADGIMLGRAIFGNPWLFAPDLSFQHSQECWNDKKTGVTGVRERLKVLVEHTRLFEKKLGKVKNFSIMKKHYKAYVNGFDGAKELRMELMEAKNAGDAESIVKEFLKYR